MRETVSIAALMRESGVEFGTSGARGLADAITDRVAFLYTTAFLEHLRRSGREGAERTVAIGGDLRPSTGRIMAAVAAAVRAFGRTPLDCGRVPSPAIAHLGITHAIPAIMVTGSHIPDDRNGIKFNAPDGEILKPDEAAIRALAVEVESAMFDDAGMLVDGGARSAAAAPGSDAAAQAYLQRWLDAFPADWLAGMTVGVYEHTAVGRDLFGTLVERLGGTALRFGRSACFIPVDTEAIRPEDVALAAAFAAEHRVDAIISSDGDSDRPLVADGKGRWLRGDVAGILVAHFLGADAVVTPVSSNSALEASGWFPRTLRTRIGSPFVIEGMREARAGGAATVVGYEANGGFLLGSDVAIEGGGRLAALPTRDAVIVHLALLGMARRAGVALDALTASLPPRVTFSDRLKQFPRDIAQARIAALETGGAAAVAASFPWLGAPRRIDSTDGLRLMFEGGDVVHLRVSGNAPELRCYTEADSEPRAAALAARVLAVLEGWRG